MKLFQKNQWDIWNTDSLLFLGLLRMVLRQNQEEFCGVDRHRNNLASWQINTICSKHPWHPPNTDRGTEKPWHHCPCWGWALHNPRPQLCSSLAKCSLSIKASPWHLLADHAHMCVCVSVYKYIYMYTVYRSTFMDISHTSLFCKSMHFDYILEVSTTGKKEQQISGPVAGCVSRKNGFRTAAASQLLDAKHIPVLHETSELERDILHILTHTHVYVHTPVDTNTHNHTTHI